MTTEATQKSPSAAAALASPQAKGARDGTPRLRADGASREARRLAAAILEVLAGVRTPAEAAQQLAISLTRYYIVEGRALHGLVAACEPRPLGRVPTPEGDLARLRREGEQLRRQCARQQALLRVTERTIGLSPAPSAPKPGGAGPKKRRRKPTARALKAAAVLRPCDPVAGGEVPREVSDSSMSP
jgi:hypothetical protein